MTNQPKLPSIQMYGRSFQINTITEMIWDSEFTISLLDVISKEYFTSLSLQFLCSEIVSHAIKYKESPSLEVLVHKVKELDRNAFTDTLTVDLGSIKKNKRKDSQFTKDKALDFCRKQNMKEALQSSIDMLQNDTKEAVEDIRQLITDASIAGITTDAGIDYVKDVDLVLEHVKRETVPTGWKPIDDALGGGLGKGELGIIMAPAGVGKSFLLGCITAHNIQRGENVIHYTLENSDSIVGVRLTANICDAQISDIEEGFDKKKLKDIIVDKVKGRLIIKQYSSVSATMNTFYSHIQLLEMKKFKPTLIVLDYADLIKGYRSSGGGSESYFLGKNLYQDLRRMAGELKIPIWSATQTKVSAYNEDIITLDQAAESSGKGHEADVMISFSRTDRDKQAGTGRFYIAKSRTSADAIQFPAVVNFSKGMITALPPDENNMKLLDKMYSIDQSETTRKELNNTFQEYKNKKRVGQ